MVANWVIQIFQQINTQDKVCLERAMRMILDLWVEEGMIAHVCIVHQLFTVFSILGFTLVQNSTLLPNSIATPAKLTDFLGIFTSK